MKKNILSLCVVATLAFGAVSCNNDKSKAGDAVKIEDATTDAARFVVDANDSKIDWIGSKVGGEHKGDLKLKSGELSVKDGVVQGGSFIIDVQSINVTDLSGDDKAKLEGHLKGLAQDESADHFFNTTKFPEGKFEISSIADEGGKTFITGNLTLKDITKSVKFPAVIKVTDNDVTVESEAFAINRTDFNINYGSGSKFTDLAADKVISDDIKLQVKVVAKK